MEGTTGKKVSPSGSGDIIESEVVNLSVLRKLGQKVGFSLKAKYFSNSTIFEKGKVRRERDFFSVEPALNWHFNKQWSFGFSYRYRQEERENISGELSSNTVYFSINYHPPNELKNELYLGIFK